MSDLTIASVTEAMEVTKGWIGFWPANPEFIQALCADWLRQREALEKANRVATDRRYMLDAYRAMLSDTGEKVAAKWEADGLLRVHFDWTSEAAGMTGEQRAVMILDIDEAPSIRITSFDDLDAPAIPSGDKHHEQ